MFSTSVYVVRETAAEQNFSDLGKSTRTIVLKVAANYD